jgi:hypothetical protein
MKDSAMHQIFQKGPGREAQHDQIEPIDAGYAHKDHRGNRYGDEVAEVPDMPHQLARQCRCRSPHWIKPLSLHQIWRIWNALADGDAGTSDRHHRPLNQICMTELREQSRLRCGEIAWRQAATTINSIQPFGDHAGSAPNLPR